MEKNIFSNIIEIDKNITIPYFIRTFTEKKIFDFFVNDSSNDNEKYLNCKIIIPTHKQHLLKNLYYTRGVDFINDKLVNIKGFLLKNGCKMKCVHIDDNSYVFEFLGYDNVYIASLSKHFIELKESLSYKGDIILSKTEKESQITHFIDYYDNNIKIISEWVHELKDEYNEISYKRIGDFLLLLKLQKFNYKKCKIPKPFLYFFQKNKGHYFKYLSDCKFGYKKCLQTEVKNIIKLHTALKNVPSIKNVLENKNSIILDNKKLVLYRGFYYKYYEKLLKLFNNNITIGNIIETPVFLSTSIDKNTAYKFIDSPNKNKNNNIMWKIIVPNDKLDIFNYTYIGLNIDISKPYSSGMELEFLLNIGCIMRCISIETHTGFLAKFQKIEEYKLYIFEFIEYSTFYQNNFVKEMKNIIKCLEDKFE